MFQRTVSPFSEKSTRSMSGQKLCPGSKEKVDRALDLLFRCWKVTRLCSEFKEERTSQSGSSSSCIMWFKSTEDPWATVTRTPLYKLMETLEPAQNINNRISCTADVSSSRSTRMLTGLPVFLSQKGNAKVGPDPPSFQSLFSYFTKWIAVQKGVFSLETHKDVSN